MKHYNPELETKVLSDLTTRQKNFADGLKDSGFLSFVGDPSSGLVDISESNNMWIETAEGGRITYESANTYSAFIGWVHKIHKTNTIGQNTWPWLYTGAGRDGSTTMYSSGATLRFGRATGYTERNDEGLYTAALDPGQTVTETTSHTTMPFAFNPISYALSMYPTDSIFEELSPVATEIQGNPGDFNFDENRTYVPKATVIFVVTGADGIERTFAAPIVTCTEYFGYGAYQTEITLAEPILTGQTYSTPGVNGGSSYVYNPTTGKTVADTLSNTHPTSVTTLGGDIVDGGIYDFGYTNADTLTNFLQSEVGKIPAQGIIASDYAPYLTGSQSTNFLTGILAGINSVFIGDREGDVRIAEFVTGSSTTFSHDVILDSEASLHAEGNISANGSLSGESLSIPGQLSVLGNDQQTLDTEGDPVGAPTTFSFPGAGTFGYIIIGGTDLGAVPVDTAVPVASFYSAPSRGHVYFIAITRDSSNNSTINGVIRVPFDAPGLGILSNTGTDRMGTGSLTYSLTYSEAEVMSAAGIAELAADPRNEDDRHESESVFIVAESEWSTLDQTSFLNATSLQGTFLQIMYGEGGSGVVVENNLTVGGSLTIEGAFCAPRIVEELPGGSGNSVRQPLTSCAINFITGAPNNGNERRYQLPIARVGHWVRLVIREDAITNTAEYQISTTSHLDMDGDPVLHQYIEGDHGPVDSFGLDQANPFFIPAGNTTLEFTYINDNNTFGWAVTSVS